MQRVLLVIPTSSYRAAEFVEAAHGLGVSIAIAADGDLGIGASRVDRMVTADFGDSDEASAVIAETMGGLSIDAVVGADDGAVLVAAKVAERLDVPHPTPDAIAATRDKARMRHSLAAAGVSQPKFAEFHTAEQAVEAAGGLGYPVVVKPTSLSASRGVIRADDAETLADVVPRVRAIALEAGGDDDDPLLIEEYIAGIEVAVEALATDDGLDVLAVFDKPDPLEGPFFEETIYVTPSRVPAADLASVEAVVLDAVRALGVDRGPVHAEVRLGDAGAVVIEVAARSIGGLCSRALRFGMLEGSLEEQILRDALGLTRRGMGRVSRSSGVMMLPTPREGVFGSVRGTEALSEVPGIRSVEITATPGRWVRPLPEGGRYLGFLFADGADPAEVESSLREGHRLLDVRIDPSGVPTSDDYC